MDVNIFKSCFSNPCANTSSNPNPEKFKILKDFCFNNYLLLLVNYPDCTNFEGNKLILYAGFSSVQDLLSCLNNKLDPHFSNSFLSPIARFLPTDKGWEIALDFINFLSEKYKC